MIRIIFTSLLVGLISLALPTQAQLLKKIQTAAQNAAQNVASQKVEQKIAKESAQEIDSAVSGMLRGMLEPASTEELYTFTGYLTMVVIAKDKKGSPEHPTRIKYLIGEDTQFMGVNFQDAESNMNMTSITDLKNQAMILLMEERGEKSSMAMKINAEGFQEIAEEEMKVKPEDYKLIKTGNRKTILGYICEEYSITSKDGEGYYWVTEKPIKGMSIFSPASSPMGGNKVINQYETLFANAPKGTFLEMLFSGKDGSSLEMKVTEIEPEKESSFKMTEYPNRMIGN
jgi:hypothetical protein